MSENKVIHKTLGKGNILKIVDRKVTIDFNGEHKNFFMDSFNEFLYIIMMLLMSKSKRTQSKIKI